MLYTIETPAGEVYGDFDAPTPADALAVMFQDARDHGVALTGTVDDWIIFPSRNGGGDFE